MSVVFSKFVRFEAHTAIEDPVAIIFHYTFHDVSLSFKSPLLSVITYGLVTWTDFMGGFMAASFISLVLLVIYIVLGVWEFTKEKVTLIVVIIIATAAFLVSSYYETFKEKLY